MTKQSISLYYREGSSDKEYQVSIEPKENGHVVNFAYGRRGSTLLTGTKTTTPVDLQTATNIFEKLVREKKAKGYTEGPNGRPYQHTDKEERVTGVQCQLLNPIDEAEVEQLIDNENWCAQEKFDGKRVLIQKQGSIITGINRKGLVIGLPVTLVTAAQVFDADFLIDGESVGDKFNGFDILQWDGKDLRNKPYRERLTALINVLLSGQQRHMTFAHTAWRTTEKAKFLQEMKQQNKEGIVFKRVDAPYTAGRPNSGGTQLKHKFYATISVMVGKVNRRRSIEVLLYGDQEYVTAGNVTVPANHQVPKAGQVVEVRYLYAFKESGCLYQPVYLGVRSDVLPLECTTAQLKFKKGEEEG